MAKFMQKPKYVEAFEYGSGDFPMWFNSLVGNLVTIFDDYIFTPKGKCGEPAGKIGNKIFKYGDIIVRHENGRIQIFNKFTFLKKYVFINE